MQKISSEANVAQKWSEKKMEEEDAWRTVECLRGRLQAERVASRNAKEETEQLENKLIKLEDQLKEEMKSRKRAEKRLRFLMKKVEALNISSSYVSADESNQSGSSSSTASSETRVINSTTRCLNVSKISTSSESRAEEILSFGSGGSSGELETPICHFEETIEKEKSSMGSNNFEQNMLGSFASSQGSDCPGMEDTSNSTGGSHCELESSGCSNESITDDHSLKYQKQEGDVNGDSYKGDDDVDNSMALVPIVDLAMKVESIDPAVLDATVKQVLNSLQSVKDKLHKSMEQRRMVKLGLDRFLCALHSM